MPTVTFDKQVLEKLVDKKLPLDTLKDRISMLGTDLEGIEGNEITVEIFPNRPDMLSEQGFARAFSSFIGVKTGLREYKVEPSGEKVIVDKSVSKIRPYTACAIVKGLKFNDEKIREIIQIQEKLHITYGRNRKKCAIGIYPYEKIKTPITFLAKNPNEIKFRPLEFPTELTGTQILSKHPTGREYGHLLEGLDKYSLFVDATGQVLSLPPIINSHETGRITEATKDVFIECSGFDFDTLSICLNIIVTTLADMGGDVYSMELNYPEGKIVTPNLTPKKIKFDFEKSNKLLGLNLKENEVKKLLEKMGYGYEKGVVLVPAYRADILHSVDLIEDISIAYGFENFDAEIPNVATVGEENSFEVFKRKIANILVGHGFLETNTYHITNKIKQTNNMLCELKYVELENALNSDYDILRSWMIPSLMQVLQDNKSNEYPQNIFEMGRIFKINPETETGVEENERLAVVLCDDGIDFTKIRQILDSLMRAIFMEYSVNAVEHPSFIPGRVGRVSVKGKEVAYIGEINPSVLHNWQVEMPVAAFELNLTELFRLFK